MCVCVCIYFSMYVFISWLHRYCGYIYGDRVLML